MILFDCEDFQVIQRTGRSDFLLITFSSLGMFIGNASVADGQTFWGRSIAEAFDYTAIGFVAKKRNWFCSPYVDGACAAVASLAAKFNKVVAYGSSMGGYAALRFGRQAGATAAVSFAPQYSIDPESVGSFDNRYSFAFDFKLHRGMEIQGEHVPPFSTIFVDPFVTQDWGHAQLIRKNATNTRVITLFSCGHECVRVTANKDLAHHLLQTCVSLDFPALQAFARVARKGASIRPVELANRLAIGRPNLARRILEKHGNAFEIGHKAALLNRLDSVISAAVGAPNSALTNERSAVSVPLVLNESPKISKAASRTRSGMLKKRIIHLHVPKTAGTALRTAFEKRFAGELRIFPFWDEAKYNNVNPNDFDFYSGHFGFDTAAKLDGDMITVLRHPVDRFLSVYYFWRQLHEARAETSLNTELASKFSLDEFVQVTDQPGLIEEFQNRCTFQIAYGSSLNQRRHLRLKGQTNDQIFQLALDNLAKFKVVGVQEDMARFSEAAAQAFGVTLNINRINVTKERPEISSISISTRKTIQEWVYMDMELYQHALRRI